MTKNFRFIALLISFVIIGLDQYIKYLAITYLSTSANFSVPIIEDFFHLTYVENRGAAFSLFEGKSAFLIGASVLISVIFIVVLLSNKVKSKFVMFAIALVIGGGIGNLVDRIARGYVVDYFDLRVINFAIFNFADCCVVVGTILIMIYILFIEGKTLKAKKVTTESEQAIVEESKQDEVKSPERVNKFIAVISGEEIIEQEEKDEH